MAGSAKKESAAKTALKNYQIVLSQEDQLVFDSFTEEDAQKLGMTVIDEARSRHVAIACDVWLNGCQVFRWFLPGTGHYHDLWLRRKARTVDMFGFSSLHVHYQGMAGGDDLVKDAFLDPNQYSVMGGGFPIRLRGAGVIGSLCVSGLTHTQDHQLAADALASYLGVRIQKVKEEKP